MRGRPKPLSNYVRASNILFTAFAVMSWESGHFTYYCLYAKLQIIFEVTISCAKNHVWATKRSVQSA